MLPQAGLKSFGGSITFSLSEDLFGFCCLSGILNVFDEACGGGGAISLSFGGF